MSLQNERLESVPLIQSLIQDGLPAVSHLEPCGSCDGQTLLEVLGSRNIGREGWNSLICRLCNPAACDVLIAALGLLPLLNLTQSPLTSPDPSQSHDFGTKTKCLCFWYTRFSKSESVQGCISPPHTSLPTREKLLMHRCRMVPAFSLRAQ